MFLPFGQQTIPPIDEILSQHPQENQDLDLFSFWPENKVMAQPWSLHQQVWFHLT